MKIYIEKPKDKNSDPTWYFHFGDAFFHFINQWSQFFWGKWNWINFDLIGIRWENEVYIGGFEAEIIILGFGIRWRWNYAFDESEGGKEIKEGLKEIDGKENKV